MFLLDGSKELVLTNPAYEKAVKHYVWGAYLLDLGKRGDITSHFFIRDLKQIVTAQIIAKDSGVLAGVMEAKWFLKKLNIRILNPKSDGDRVRKGETLMTLSGKAIEILGAERTLLNLLQRMSGIATATHRLLSKLPTGIKLLATRKTFWGDLDKRAVSLGGGATHRFNLADAILVKENHLALSGDLKNTLSMVIQKVKGVRFIEIELENLKQVKDFARFHKNLPASKKMVVMLDNFKPTRVKQAIEILKPTDVLVEVSGGIDEKNIKKYALKGVSAISSGSITNKAPALDMSLNII